MSTLAAEASEPQAVDVQVSDHALSVALSDGRTISVPIDWYPRLVRATHQERCNWTLIGAGHGIHWADVDEDISIENLLLGKASRESPSSLSKWLERRSAFPCPIPGCDKIFHGSRGGWDAHVGSLRIHPDWHADVTDEEKRKWLFKKEYVRWFKD